MKNWSREIGTLAETLGHSTAPTTLRGWDPEITYLSNLDTAQEAVSALWPCLFGPRQTWQNCICALSFLSQHTFSQLRCLCAHYHPTFLALRAPGSMCKSKLRYLWVCHCDQDQNLPSVFCYSPSILHLNPWLSGAEAGNGQRLNQEWEKLTGLATSFPFFFLPSSIGTVLNYTKIACKTLINLICLNAAFPHESFTVTQVNTTTCFRDSGAPTLFIQPKVHWFAWSLTASFLSLKDYTKINCTTIFSLRSQRQEYSGSSCLWAAQPRKEKCHISAFLHSSFLSSSAHEDTQTGSRHSWSNIANQATSLAQCNTKSDFTCL